VKIGRKLVVGDHRGDRGDQPQRGGEQRLRDAGSDDREARILRGGDRLELSMMPQTVPNRPTKGAVEPTVAR